MRQAVSTDSAPAALGPYSQAISTQLLPLWLDLRHTGTELHITAPAARGPRGICPFTVPGPSARSACTCTKGAFR